MIRILFIDVGGTVIAENGEEEVEIGGEGSLETEDEDYENEDVEEERDGEDAPFESGRVRVKVENIEVRFGG